MSVHDQTASRSLGELNRFREEFYQALTRRADGLFELADAVLCMCVPRIASTALTSRVVPPAVRP